MQALSQFLDSVHSVVQINLQDREWHLSAGVPHEPGWYFIRTNAPVSVLAAQQLWEQQYRQPTTGQLADLQNYYIAEKASRYSAAHPRFWNTEEGYSGMARSEERRVGKECVSRGERGGSRNR